VTLVSETAWVDRYGDCGVRQRELEQGPNAQRAGKRHHLISSLDADRRVSAGNTSLLQSANYAATIDNHGPWGAGDQRLSTNRQWHGWPDHITMTPHDLTINGPAEAQRHW